MLEKQTGDTVPAPLLRRETRHRTPRCSNISNILSPPHCTLKAPPQAPAALLGHGRQLQGEKKAAICQNGKNQARPCRAIFPLTVTGFVIRGWEEGGEELRGLARGRAGGVCWRVWGPPLLAVEGPRSVLFAAQRGSCPPGQDSLECHPLVEGMAPCSTVLQSRAGDVDMLRLFKGMA